MPRSISRLIPGLVCGLLVRPALPQTSPLGANLANAILAPSIDSDGRAIAFSAAISPDGTSLPALEAWLWTGTAPPRRLTNYSSVGQTYGVTSCTLSSDASHVAYITYAAANQASEVHLIDTATGTDSRLSTDQKGCAQPLVICPGVACLFPCVHDPHVTPGGGVLYATSRAQPFYVAQASGAVTNLPIYAGQLAPGSQRVISETGQVVFTSSSVNGPVTAGAATDVYLMNLDGTSIRNLTNFTNPNISAQNAVISAGGQTIAFESNYPGGQDFQIFTIQSDGSGLRSVSSGPDTPSGASLSADGSLLAFVQSGQVNLVHTGQNGATQALTNYRYSGVKDAVLSDDGSHVAFSLGPVQGGRGAIYDSAVSGAAPTSVFVPLALNTNGVADVTGWTPGSPGSLVSIYGLNLSSDDELLTAGAFPLPVMLGQVSLLVNGQKVPLSSMTRWQLNAQLPQTTPTGTVTFQLESNGTPSNSITAQVQASAPSVFAFQSSGEWFSYWQAAAYHAGTATVADATHPAAAGETLETYGSGLGVTIPPVAAGQPSPAMPPARAAVTPTVTIGNEPAHVNFAGLVPGLAGIYQINVIVPSGLDSGLQVLNWTDSTSGASIYVK